MAHGSSNATSLSQNFVDSDYPGLLPQDQPFAIDNKIITIHPTDRTAKLAFSGLAEQLSCNNVSTFHAKYMHISSQKQDLIQNAGDISSGTDSSGPKTAQTLPKIFGGYYHIGLESPPLTGNAVWALGKGSSKTLLTVDTNLPSAVTPNHRNVDLLLAYHKHHYAGQIHSTHAYLKIHPQSGAWMISAGSSCKSVNHKVGQTNNPEDCTHNTIILDHEKLRHFETRCLTKTQSTLIIGGLSFLIQFSVRYTEQEGSYIAVRNRFLAQQHAPIPKTAISGIPFWSDYRTTHAVWREPIGSGAFGVVFSGVNPISGDLRAIKKWAVLRKNTRDQAVQEIMVNLNLNTLSDIEGIVRIFGWNNGSGEQRFLEAPAEFFLYMECGVSFKDTHWPHEMDLRDWPARRHLLRDLVKQLLKGLKSIHKKGWMHRDVTQQNILYFPATAHHAASAKLCDFGKVSMTPTSNYSSLAAEIYRAPEVGRGYYDQKIDIWGLALALVYVWYPDTMVPETVMRKEQDHKLVIRQLQKKRDHRYEFLGSKPPKEWSNTHPWASLIDLIVAMLSYKSEDRPTATHALHHPTFAELQSVGSGNVTRGLSEIPFNQDGKRLR